MKENQNIEWKEIWKDEYLKWICAFANSNGGLLYIGVNDKGKVTGVEDPEGLVYKVPHKVRDFLGITVEARVKTKKSKNYVVIKVEKNEFPISYKGKYFLRSGSNTFEAVGIELDRLILKKIGRRFEEMEERSSSLYDLDNKAIEAFKELSLESGRLPEENINIGTEMLLKNLRLIKRNSISKAGLLIFGKDPEFWVNGSYIKIALFAPNNIDIIEEDEIHGSILFQTESALNLIYEKYIPLLEKYEGLKNVRQALIPKTVMREIILNAVQHRAYDSQNPIQVGIYRNKITIANQGELNESLSTEEIYNPHPALPHNPNIARTFYYAGFSSSWGLGMEKIKRDCTKRSLPLPKCRLTKTGIIVRCNPKKEFLHSLRRELVRKSKEELLAELASDPTITEEDIKRILEKRNN